MPNMISLEVLNKIPLDGVDTHILCDKCSAACCTKGTILPLTKKEAEGFAADGTMLSHYPMETSQSLARRVLVHAVHPFKEGRELYELESDCSHLKVSDETGKMECGAYYDEARPRICSEFKTGSYACALLQLKRFGNSDITAE